LIKVSEFMREVAEPLAPARRFTVERGLVAFAPVLGDRPGDGFVKTAVQDPKVVRADGRIGLQRQLGDGLTDVAIVVDHLRDGESLEQEVVTVLDRGPSDLGARAQPEAQGLHQLIQEHRHAVVDLTVGGRGHRSNGNLRPAAPDDLGPVDGDEFVQHKNSGAPMVSPALSYRMSRIAQVVERDVWKPTPLPQVRPDGPACPRTQALPAAFRAGCCTRMWLSCLAFATAMVPSFAASFCFWSRCFALSDLSPMAQSWRKASGDACRELNNGRLTTSHGATTRSRGNAPHPCLRSARDRLVDVLNRTDAGASVPHTGSARRILRGPYRSDDMDTNTLLIIVVLVLLLGGGGFYYNRRGV
jgi:hypothetical protein